MNRFNDLEEKEIFDLLKKMIEQKDFWSGNPPFPERIGFQRFGLQLREEDFELIGADSVQGFYVRDRNVNRKVTSGFSVVKNDEKDFKVELDVWPFKHHEIAVMILTGNYFTVKGEHDERLEDNSLCTRKFQRYYCLPRGANSKTIKCSYCNGILTATLQKGGVDNETPIARIVPISLVDTCIQNGQVPFTEQYTTEMQTVVRNVPIDVEDPENGNEQDLKSGEPLKDFPATNKDSKEDEVMKAKAAYEAAVANLAPNLRDAALKNAPSILKVAFDLKSDNESGQKSDESAEKPLGTKEDSDDINIGGNGDKISDDGK